MHVLLVSKTTNLEQHGDVIRLRISRGFMTSDHLDDLKIAHDQHYASLDQVKASLESAGITYDHLQRDDLVYAEQKYDGIFTVGGDGTLLSASHMADDNTPLLGICSSNSSVGYLCAVKAPDIGLLVDRFKDGKVDYHRCTRVKASVFHVETREHTETAPALNDFLFTSANPAATTRYIIKVGDRREVHKSSGIWVATGTGSTGGISAAGGEKVDPECDDLMFLVREPYVSDGAKLKNIKGVFGGNGGVFTVENRTTDAILALDGQREVVPLVFGDRITFKPAMPALVARKLKTSGK